DFEQALCLDADSGKAYGGRALARVQLGQHKKALADAEEALRREPKDARTAYTMARVYALVAESSGRGRVHEEEMRHHARALRLLRDGLALLPAGERSAFWKEYVHKDPALKSLQRTSAYAELATQYSGGPLK